MTRKIAIITGGSRGLGANAALKLATRGTDLIITYKQDITSANAVVSQVVERGSKAVALQLDAGSIASIPAFVESVRTTLAQWGADRFDILVNNAGMGSRGLRNVFKRRNYSLLSRLSRVPHVSTVLASNCSACRLF